MSDITAIYATIAGMDITIDGTTPRVQNLADLTTSIPSSDLPVRILHPFSNRVDATLEFIAMGTMASVTWVVTDMLLWKPGGQGDELMVLAQDLIAYCAAYMEASRFIRGLATQAHIQSLKAAPGLVEYPARSGTLYYGATCVYTIQEVLSG